MSLNMKTLTQALTKTAAVIEKTVQTSVQTTVQEVTGPKPLQDYELIDQIGSAGPGLAWRLYSARARDPSRQHQYPVVCVWVLDKRAISEARIRAGLTKAAEDSFLDLLRTDAGKLVRLRHPGVVHVVQALEECKNAMVMVTEPLFASVANTLGNLDNVASVPKELGGMEMGLLEVKHGLLQMAESLDFLHNHAHLVHRAISPENVLITLSGAWKLGGFSFAISSSQISGDSAKVPAFHYAEYDVEDSVLPIQPSLNYTAPELVRSTASSAGWASDIFSFGCLAYHLIARKPLFDCHNNVKMGREGKNHLYKVSLSLVVVLWGLVFLFSLWISRSHGYADGSEEYPVGASNWNEDKHGQCKSSDSFYEYLIKDTDAHIPSEAETKVFVGESLPSGESRDYAIPDPTCWENSNSSTRDKHEVESYESAAKLENDVQKSDHLSWAVPLGLDEFKSKATSSKIKSGNGPSGNVIHRVEPGGAEYNYASASKGAKVLASNKESKGSSNILSRDRDKYLRNPCTAEEKFVIIELSEETLVDTIEIANFEHHSSNLKDFELHGSLVYPTDIWVFLGNFTALNVKHAQRFVLQEPKWVRYLKLNLKSHYGSEFYCTLSIVEVHGVDAVERMLEDLIYTQDNLFGEGNGDKRTVSPKAAEGEDVNQHSYSGINSDPTSDISSANHETVNSKVPDPVEEMHQQVGRMPGDTVLKILMQKVHSLDLSLSVLERYLDDLNSRYVNIFEKYRKDIGEKEIFLQKIKEEIRSLRDQLDVTAENVSDLNSWKSHVSLQLDLLLRDNAVLRSEVEKIQERQVSLENKGVVVFFVCCIFSLLAILRLFVNMATSVYRVPSVNRTVCSGKFCSVSSSWFFLLLNCSIIILILTL